MLTGSGAGGTSWAGRAGLPRAAQEPARRSSAHGTSRLLWLEGAESSPWLLASFPGSQDASREACRLSGVPVLSLERLLSPTAPGHLPPVGAKPNTALCARET